LSIFNIRRMSMFKTKMTEMLGVKYPIVGGTMMHISNAEFTAAISNAGGLGILASAIYQSREAFSEALDQLIELTDKPFAVNLNLFPAMRPIDNNDYLDVLLEKRVKIVETSGHSAPQELCARFKEAGLNGRGHGHSCGLRERRGHRKVGYRYARVGAAGC
jgi:nitronate monooxygenase